MVRTARRRATAVLVGLAGAGLGLVVAARPLASGEPGAGGLTTATRLTASGSALAPAYPALLLVAAAAAVALAFAGPRLRPVVAVLLGAAGAGAEVAWRMGLADAEAGLSRTTVPPGLPVHNVAVSGLSWVGDVAAILVVVAAGLALAFGSQWARGSRRYDAPAGSRAAGTPGEAGRPAASPSSSSSPGRASTAAASAGGGSAAATPGRRTDDDWDALSRGEDPTA